MEKTADEEGERNHELPEAAPQDGSLEVAGPAQMVSVSKFFSMADGWDVLLMVVGSCAAVLRGSLGSVTYFLFGEIFKSFQKEQNGSTNGLHILANDLRVIAYTYMLLTALYFIGGTIETACWMYTGERQSGKLRLRYVQAILKQEVGYFDTDANTAEFLDCITESTLLIQDGMGEKVGHGIAYSWSTLCCLVVAVVFCWQLALLTFVVIPTLAVIKGCYQKALTNVSQLTGSAQSTADSIVEETISQIRTVFSFVGEERAEKRFSDALKNCVKLGAKAGLVKGLGLGFLHGTLNASWGLMFYVGGALITGAHIHPNRVIVTILCVVYGGLTFGFVVPDIEAFQKGRTAAYRLHQILDREPSVRDSEDAKDLVASRMEGAMELQEIHFFYPSRPEAVIFADFSVTIPAGRSLAFVGQSGSGKSTIISLLARFYDPQQGRVTVDGMDMKKLTILSLRSVIGMVGQEPVLFDTTVMDNIRFGRPSATDDDCKAAAKAANAHAFISALPDTYDTHVGNRGMQLSGGQKQRIAIARAVLKNPAILLLDEATSALDAESERIVQEALDSLMLGKTSVVVAHRLSTIRNVDSIAVLEGGKIVEQGSHSELMSKGGNGKFFQISQTLGSQDSNSESSSNEPSPIEAASNNDGTPRSSLTWRSNSRHAQNPSLDFLRSYNMSFSPSMGQGSSAFSEGHTPGRLSGFEDPRKSQATAAEIMDLSSEFASEKDKSEPILSSFGVAKEVAMLAAPEWARILLGCLGSIALAAVKPATCIVCVKAILVFFQADSKSVRAEVGQYCVAFLIIGVFTVITSTIESSQLLLVGEKISQTVRQRVFKAILKTDVGWFDQKENSSATLMGRIATDGACINLTIGSITPAFVNNLAALVMAISYCVVLNFWMTLVSIGTIPLYVLGSVARVRIAVGHAGATRASHEQATAFAAESVTNIRTVASFTMEIGIVERLKKLLEEPLENSKRHCIEAGFLNGAGGGMTSLGYGLTMLYLAHALEKHQTTFAPGFTIFQVISNTTLTLSEFMTVLPLFGRVESGVQSVVEILTRKPVIDPNGGKKRKSIQGSIELQRVQFRYPTRPKVLVLNDVNLKILPGQTVALVGESGSGKSSIVSLLERFYDPTSGRVAIDGVDLKELDLKWVRERIALVQQEPMLFNTTIRNNIVYGREAATEGEIVQAAKVANAHKFICGLPDGYNTGVGDRGTQLSGGQKQRIAIARAVLKNPSILLLDEATSALDSESQKVVQAALDKMMAGASRTTLVIAHNLSTIQRADVIVVMKSGKVVEQGNHDRLIMAKGGVYSRLLAAASNNHH